jgi:TolA-binding protein
VRVHVRDASAKAAADRFRLEWTPTTLILDANGGERHRIEGFLPPKDFAAQLLLGLAHAARHSEDWKEAQRRFGEVLERFPETDAAPEALYWKGVARYKETGDAEALKETTRAFQTRYTDSTWAKKGSVWV